MILQWLSGKHLKQLCHRPPLLFGNSRIFLLHHSQPADRQLKLHLYFCLNQSEQSFRSYDLGLPTTRDDDGAIFGSIARNVSSGLVLLGVGLLRSEQPAANGRRLISTAEHLHKDVDITVYYYDHLLKINPIIACGRRKKCNV